MKKLLLVVVALAAVSGIALADVIYGDIVTPASHNVTVTVTIPPRVGIDIAAGAGGDAMALDLSGDATYPPVAAAYWPIGANTISIIATGNYRYDYATDGSGLLAGLLVSEFEYQTSGWGAGAWTAFGAGANLEDPAARTAGWVGRNMNYRVSLDGAETAGANVLVITYTVTAEL